MEVDLRYELVNSYRELYKALMTLLRSACEAAGLSLLEFFALKMVLEQSGLSLGELAEALMMAESKCSVVVDQLYRRGLLDRTRSSEDRRRVVLQLTDAGQAVLSRLFSPGAPLRKALEDSFDLEPAALRRLIEANRKLTENLRRYRGTAV
jgi:DNA-binding MarR family transcriptional regulator